MPAPADNSRGPADDPYARWLAANPPTPPGELEARRRRFGHQALISVLMPVHDPALRHLQAAITSVQRQTYGRWELCMVDDCSSEPAIRRLLEDACRSDERLKVGFRERGGHICRASNDALALCRGEFVALLDHDDLLHPEALHYVAEAIDRQPDVDLIFSDEDKIDERGRRFDPHFKHRLHLDILWALNFVSHLGVYRRALLEEVGGFRPGFEGSQDHDLALRVLERSDLARVCHIPRVLYHWRVTATSTAGSAAAKSYASDAGRRAVGEHFERLGQPAQVVATSAPGVYRVHHRRAAALPSVCVVVIAAQPPGLHVEAIGELVRSLRRVPADLLIGGTPEQFARLQAQASERYSQHRWRRLEATTANCAQLLNEAVGTTEAEMLVFVAPYLRPRAGAHWAGGAAAIEPKEGWLLEMLGQLGRPDVGVVGGRVVDCHGRVDSCGLALGADTMVGKLHYGTDVASPGYMFRAMVVQEVSAVSAGLMGIRRQALAELGGFDPRFRDEFYDVDLCLRARRRGLKVVATPFATLQMSHGLELRARAWQAGLVLLIRKHLHALQAEPFVSPHLAVCGGNLVLRLPGEAEAAAVDKSTPMC